MRIEHIFKALSLNTDHLHSGYHPIYSPIDGELIANIHLDNRDSVHQKIETSVRAFQQWRNVPAPKRGELVRQFGNKLREHKSALASLITLECGKIVSESEGEVQEMIDICDFAVGQSRQLYGLTIASERPDHALRETWHPLGPTAIITAFNFPMAVWAWNASLALVCGNSIIWKPSELTPLCAMACQALFEEVANTYDLAPPGLSALILGEAAMGEQLVEDKRIPLVSATGSCAMGQQVGAKVAARFGKSLLELGGNNALIVTAHADLDMAIRAITFGAVGTAGQRCTTTRRVFAHSSVAKVLLDKLTKVYASLPIGDPNNPDTLIGPLIHEQSFNAMQTALQDARNQGCEVIGGDRIDPLHASKSYYVTPAVVIAGDKIKNNQVETFAPILYFFEYDDLNDAIARQNDVPQGLSSAILTNNMQEAELFLSARGSDCGIANVNVGTSGAEIGGAFGGEKATGGGRESGSDAWKAYMRRSTATINFSSDLPLAQGISFDV